ncbi:MAG: methyltransferase domain-containing protein [Polyangiales bacterium]
MLPDVSRFLDLPAPRWLAFAERLRALGVERGAVAPYAKIGEKLPAPMRGPMVRWNLRRTRTPLVLALRMFFFMDPIDREGAREVLGELFAPLLEIGFVVERGEGLVCPFFVNLVNDTFVVCDDLSLGGEAVMGAGATTGGLIQAAYPTQRISSALDLGCGAGTAALLFASKVDRVVGIDINPRAIVLSKVNARINGITNVEFLEGDFFAPVANEKFDLIVSQPPFVSLPDESTRATFLHGGRRGDEITLGVLERVAPHLAPGGRAVVLLDCPKVGDEKPVQRLRAAVGPDSNLLLLVSTPKNLDDHCTFYAASSHATLGPDFERAAIAHREHLARVGIEELRLVLVVAEETKGRAPFTTVVQTRSFSEIDPSNVQIERLLATHNLLANDDSTFFATPLQAPNGLRFVDEGGRVVARLQEPALIPPIVCSAQAAQLVSMFSAPSTPAEVCDRFAAKIGMDAGSLRPQIVAAVRQALESQLLEVAQSQ